MKNTDIIVRPFYGLGFEWNTIKFIENGSTDLSTILNSNMKTYSISNYDIPLRLGIDFGANFRLSKSIEMQVHTFFGYKLNFINAWYIGGSTPILMLIIL